MGGWRAAGAGLPRLTPAARRALRTMIDDDREAMTLMQAMNKGLPVPAYPSKELISLFKQKNIKIKADQCLEMIDVYYCEDEGGISFLLKFPL
jgi:hypothetical protein